MNVSAMAHRRLAQMAGLELGWRLHLGELLGWAVGGLAMLMSYHAEAALGQSLKAFVGWPATVWPLSVDVADVCLMVLYLEYKRLRLSTWKVGLGMIAATAVMIAANVRSAWPDPTAVAMQAWVPGIALWLWHTLAAGRKPRGAPVDLAVVWARLTRGAADDLVGPAVDEMPSTRGARADAVPSGERNRQARVPARAEVQRVLRRHRGALTDAELRRLAVRVHVRTGVSIPHARRLLRAEHEPRLVEVGADG